MTRITIFESVGNKSSCKEIGQLFRPFKAVTTFWPNLGAN